MSNNANNQENQQVPAGSREIRGSREREAPPKQSDSNKPPGANSEETN